MKYADMIKDASYTRVAYFTDVLNAVVAEASASSCPAQMIESVTCNWRLTGAEHAAIVEEARRIMKI